MDSENMENWAAAESAENHEEDSGWSNLSVSISEQSSLLRNKEEVSSSLNKSSKQESSKLIRIDEIMESNPNGSSDHDDAKTLGQPTLATDKESLETSLSKGHLRIKVASKLTFDKLSIESKLEKFKGSAESILNKNESIFLDGARKRAEMSVHIPHKIPSVPLFDSMPRPKPKGESQGQKALQKADGDSLGQKALQKPEGDARGQKALQKLGVDEYGNIRFGLEKPRPKPEPKLEEGKVESRLKPYGEPPKLGPLEEIIKEKGKAESKLNKRHAAGSPDEAQGGEKKPFDEPPKLGPPVENISEERKAESKLKKKESGSSNEVQVEEDPFKRPIEIGPPAILLEDLTSPLVRAMEKGNKQEISKAVVDLIETGLPLEEINKQLQKHNKTFKISEGVSFPVPPLGGQPGFEVRNFQVQFVNKVGDISIINIVHPGPGFSNILPVHPPSRALDQARDTRKR
jgi:hypothetical protein